MKNSIFISMLFIFLISPTFASTSVESAVQTEQTIKLDRNNKRKRREKRINKKRKRKCHQFARRVYAG